MPSPSLSSSMPRVRTLVIGAGFLGSHITRRLVDVGHRVTVMARNKPSGSALSLIEGADLLLGDASVAADVAEGLAGTGNVVFALSSLMPGEADRTPEMDMSLALRPLLVVLQLLKETPDVSLTFLSSGGTIYGAPSIFPTPEDAPTEPFGAYGITKLASEKFVLRHRKLNGSPVRILRISNAYGPGQSTSRGQGFIASAMEKCITGEPLTVFGDGSVSRDFVHVEDAAAAIAALIELGDGPEVLNLGSGTSVSVAEVRDLVESAAGRHLTVDYLPARSFDVPKVQLDISRLRSTVDVNFRSLAVGIQQTWAELVVDISGPGAVDPRPSSVR